MRPYAAAHVIVNQRWLGGMLTNFQTIQLRIRYMKDLEARKEAGEFDRLTKKEAQHLEDQLDPAESHAGRHPQHAPSTGRGVRD